MFAGDFESDCSLDAHDQVSPTRSQGGDNKTNPTQNDLLDHQITTPEELEFGWSANLSGIRGLTEQQARRILSFERSLRQHLQLEPAEDTREQETNVKFGDPHRRFCLAQSGLVPPNAYQRVGLSLTDGPYIPSRFGSGEPLEVISARCHQAAETRDSLSSGVLITRASLPKYRRLACSGLNQSLRMSRSQSSSLSFRSHRRSKSRASNMSNESDEFCYMLARRHIGQSFQEIAESNETVCMTTSNVETGLRGFVNKISRALVRPNTVPRLRKLELDNAIEEDDLALCNLSHDMVGAASPFPMRPPLHLAGGNHSKLANEDWMGVSRNFCSKYNR